MDGYDEAVILNRLFDAYEFVYGSECNGDVAFYLGLQLERILWDGGAIPKDGAPPYFQVPAA